MQVITTLWVVVMVFILILATNETQEERSNSPQVKETTTEVVKVPHEKK